MTKTEIAIINRAITILQLLVDKPQEGGPPSQPSPIERFVQEFLALDPSSDFGCQELWRFFQEIVQAGELPAMRKATFLRQLPTVIEEVYNIKKCHHVERFGRQVRGFRGVNSRSAVGQPAVSKAEPG
jgi:hypothetical protein